MHIIHLCFRSLYSVGLSKYIAFMAVAVFLSACSDEPDCVTTPEFAEKVKARDFKDLSKHVTCYDKDGNAH